MNYHTKLRLVAAAVAGVSIVIAAGVAGFFELHTELLKLSRSVDRQGGQNCERHGKVEHGRDRAALQHSRTLNEETVRRKRELDLAFSRVDA